MGGWGLKFSVFLFLIMQAMATQMKKKTRMKTETKTEYSVRPFLK